MSKREIYLGLVAAFLSFLGAVMGSYLSSVLEQKNWETRFQVQQKVIILEKRKKLLEEVTELFVSMPRVHAYAIHLKNAPAVQQLVVDCLKSAQGLENECDKDAKERREATAERAELVFTTKAKLEAALMQAHLYFGQNTKQSISKLTSDPLYTWYEPDEEKTKQLISSMYEELFL